MKAVVGSITFFSSWRDVFDCRDERCFVLYNGFGFELKTTLLMISRKQLNGVNYLTDPYVSMRCWRLTHLDASLCQVMELCNVIIVCLGAFCIPVYMPYILTGRWMLGRGLCKLWLVMDYLLCTASVFNIVLISYDRFLSVTRAVRTSFNHIHTFKLTRYFPIYTV